MPEQDKEANDMRTSLQVLLWPKDSTILNSIDLEQVSILDDLVGEEASLSTIRGGARRSTLQVQDRPRQQQHVSQDSHLLSLSFMQ